MKRLVRMTTVPLIAAFSITCQSPTGIRMPEQPAHAQGIVTANPVPEREHTFLLERSRNPQPGDRYYVRVDSRSEIYRRSFAGKLTRINLEDIAVGSSAQAWFDGIVLESDPSQAIADVVVVEDIILEQR